MPAVRAQPGQLRISRATTRAALRRRGAADSGAGHGRCAGSSGCNVGTSSCRTGADWACAAAEVASALAQKMLVHAGALPSEEAADLEASEPPLLSVKLLQPFVSIASRYALRSVLSPHLSSTGAVLTCALLVHGSCICPATLTTPKPTQLPSAFSRCMSCCKLCDRAVQGPGKASGDSSLPADAGCAGGLHGLLNPAGCHAGRASLPAAAAQGPGHRQAPLLCSLGLRHVC